jgi:hypothetical protein
MRLHQDRTEVVSIFFDPKTWVKKIAPENKLKKLVKGNLTLKKAALNFANGIAEADDISIKLNKKAITDVALKTVRDYQQREAKAAVDAGFDAGAGKDLAEEIVDDPKLLIQRVQNQVVFQVHTAIKTQYKGQRGRWLPSSAEEPRPEHQKNYGKEYVIGEGIDGVEPGDEWGCQCGVEILTDETQLELS